MDFEAMYHHIMAESTDSDPVEHFPRENVTGGHGMSDSWSDMSDCEGNVDLGVSAISRSHNGDRATDTSDHRLSQSLDLGHGSFDHHEPHSWQGYHERTQSMGRSASNSPSRNDSRPKTEPDQGDKIKVKLMSAWNNMRYGWTVKTKTNFKVDSPIWLLGKCYHCTQIERDTRQQNSIHGKSIITTFEVFKRDFISRIWFTYRKDFSKLTNSPLTSDVGWGCMLRSGQMMLAQAFLMHFLGREWRWFPQQKPHELVYHRQIIKYFGDSPSDESPFSLHKLVHIGTESGKQPGDWFGPASVAFVLREAMERAQTIDPILSQVCLYVAQDCTVYKQDVIDLCTKSTSRRNSARSDSTSSEHSNLDDRGLSSSPQQSASSYGEQIPQMAGSAQLSRQPHSHASQRINPFDSQFHFSARDNHHNQEPHWKPVIILIPVRLGGEAFNPIYTPCVQSLLVLDYCIGIIGGRPKHSLYFIGWQDDKLIHLDPHFCQEFVDMKQRDFNLSSFHCMSPRKMSFSKMDPSCTIGFYCRTKAEFDRFVIETMKMAAPPKEKGLYPMFVFQDGRSIDVSYGATSSSQRPDRYLRVQHLDKKGRVKNPAKESDDFVFL